MPDTFEFPELRRAVAAARRADARTAARKRRRWPGLRVIRRARAGRDVRSGDHRSECAVARSCRSAPPPDDIARLQVLAVHGGIGRGRSRDVGAGVRAGDGAAGGRQQRGDAGVRADLGARAGAGGPHRARRRPHAASSGSCSSRRCCSDRSPPSSVWPARTRRCVTSRDRSKAGRSGSRSIRIRASWRSSCC